jgi:hypothetical protein
MELFIEKWWKHGSLGFLLFGTGLSVLLDASAKRMAEMKWEIWFAEGTAGYILLMSGLAFFGSAVRYLVLMNLESK